MATRKVVVLICDLCEKDEHQVGLIETHTIHVDGNGVEFETCAPCWQDGVLALLGRLSTVGRKVAPKKVTKRKEVWPWPGSEWDFTAHALTRMAERRVEPRAAVQAAEEPTLVRPAREPGLEIRTRRGVKAVVNPERQIIITVARAEEEVESVA